MKTLIKALVPVASAAALVMGGASAASAETVTYYDAYDAQVVQGTGSNTADSDTGTSCSADIHRSGDDPSAAWGVFINNNSGFTCKFYLQYAATPTDRTYGSWVGYGSYAYSSYDISGSGYGQHNTSMYNFPFGQEYVRVCFQLTNGSWTGALHCTWNGI